LSFAKRRTYFVKKGFQLRLIIIILLLVTIVANLTGGVVYGILKTELARDWLARMFSLRTDEVLLPAVILAELFSVILVAFISLFVTHRIAGPVYRFEKVCEEVEAGRFDVRVRLREKDEFKDLADAFNQMLLTLEDKLARIKILTVQMNASTSQIEGDGEKNLTKKEVLDQIKEINPIAQELNGILASFQITTEAPSSEENPAGKEDDDSHQG
jgi:methyl-accepting chemotaxis protein